MAIRIYEPGDERAQASIYNAAAGSLPGFKPAKADEISRRYQASDFDPASRFYAVENGEIVGYAVFGPNGRISYPWCLPEAQRWREPLLETVLAEMANRRFHEAWTAYRADWSVVLGFLKQHAFRRKREMINYVADLAHLSCTDELPSSRVIQPVERRDLPRLLALSPRVFSDSDLETVERFLWDNPFYDFAESRFALKSSESGEIVGACVLVIDNRFADPTKIDAAMPCFRLGAFGAERERHKRVNGLFSCAFADGADGEVMITSNAVWSKARRAGLAHVAAQAPSDAADVCALYDRHFQRQGAFPIMARTLSR
jgi:hypothetical protein